MFNFVNRHKTISILILINIIAIVAVIIAIIIHYSKTATVNINVTPINATVTLNDKAYDNQASHNIFPGHYHVKIAMDGMQTKEFDITLEGNSLALIQDYLLDEKGGFSYYLTHPNDYNVLVDIASRNDEKAQAFVEKNNKALSIEEILPIEYSNSYDQEATEIISIHIDFGDERQCGEGARQCLVIWDYTGKNQELALSLIKESGYNPDDYDLVFLTEDDSRW